MKNKKSKVGLWSALTAITAILTIAAIVGNIIANQYATTINVALNSVPQNQNWLRCHLSGSDGRPDAGVPPPSGGPGHRHHCGGVYHGQGHWLCG